MIKLVLLHLVFLKVGIFKNMYLVLSKDLIVICALHLRKSMPVFTPGEFVFNYFVAVLPLLRIHALR